MYFQEVININEKYIEWWDIMNNNLHHIKMNAKEIGDSITIQIVFFRDGNETEEEPDTIIWENEEDPFVLLYSIMFGLIHAMKHREPIITRIYEPPTEFIFRINNNICELIADSFTHNNKILHINLLFLEMESVRVNLSEIVEIVINTTNDYILFLNQKIKNQIIIDENYQKQSTLKNIDDLTERSHELQDIFYNYQQSKINPDDFKYEKNENPSAYYSLYNILIPPITIWGSKFKTANEIERDIDKDKLKDIVIKKHFNIILGQFNVKLYNRNFVFNENEVFGNIYLAFSNSRMWYDCGEYTTILHKLIDICLNKFNKNIFVFSFLESQLICRLKNGNRIEILCGYLFTPNGLFPEEELFNKKNNPQTVTLADFVEAVIKTTENYFHTVQYVFKWDIQKKPKLLKLKNKLEKLKEEQMMTNENITSKGIKM